MSNIFSRLLNNSKNPVPEKKKVFINTPIHAINKTAEQQREMELKHAAEVQERVNEKNQEKELKALKEAKEKETAIHAKNMMIFEKIYTRQEIPETIEERLLELKVDSAELFLFYMFHMKGLEKLKDDAYLKSLSVFIEVKYAKFYTSEKIKKIVKDKFLFLRNVELSENSHEEPMNLSFFYNICLRTEKLFGDTILYLWSPYMFLKPIVSERAPGEYEVYFNVNCTLRVNLESKTSFSNYFVKVNAHTLKRIECNFEKLTIANEQLTTSEKNMIRNFVNKIPKEFILVPYFYRHLEYYIAAYPFGESIVESSFNDREIHVGWYHLNNKEIKKTAKALKEDYFDKLLQILKKNISIEEKLLPALIWVEFKKQAKEMYAVEWIEEYGGYFEDSSVDMDELLFAYCNINEIDVTDNQNIGYLTYYLMNLSLFDDNTQFLANHERLSSKIEEMKEQKNLVAFEQKLMQTSDSKKQSVKFNDLDLMTGEEFEYAIAELFKRMGYIAAVTKASGDQGIDIIAEKNGRQLGIQTKCYGTKVTNTAVQEAAAGIVYHNCDRGVVVTNNYFTLSAIELASKNNIILWDRDMLKEKFMEF